MSLLRKFELVGAGIRFFWSDDVECLLAYRRLRLACRCAHCEDELTHERRLDEKRVPADVIAVEVLEIGRYGVQILWSDGHETGIFPFEVLRDLCEKCGLKE